MPKKSTVIGLGLSFILGFSIGFYNPDREIQVVTETVEVPVVEYVEVEKPVVEYFVCSECGIQQEEVDVVDEVEKPWYSATGNIEVIEADGSFVLYDCVDGEVVPIGQGVEVALGFPYILWVGDDHSKSNPNIVYVGSYWEESGQWERTAGVDIPTMWLMYLDDVYDFKYTV